VDVERFWAIVDSARDDVDGWSADLDRQWAHALYTRLVALAPDDVLDFDRQLVGLRRAVASPELAAATQLVVRPYSGSSTDPSFVAFDLKFGAFVNCLVMLGRDTLERAAADPDSLAGHPLVRAVADGELPGSVLLAVRVDDAAGDAYCELTGVDDDTYLDLRSLSIVDGPGVSGDDDEDEYDDDEDEDDAYAAWVAERLPRLRSMFPQEAEQTAEPPAERHSGRAPVSAFLRTDAGRLLAFVAVVGVLVAIGLILRLGRH
jgi:hypothetical protein